MGEETEVQRGKIIRMHVKHLAQDGAMVVAQQMICVSQYCYCPLLLRYLETEL